MKAGWRMERARNTKHNKKFTDLAQPSFTNNGSNANVDYSLTYRPKKETTQTMVYPGETFRFLA